MLLPVLLRYSTILVFWYFGTLGPMQSILNHVHKVYMYQTWAIPLFYPNTNTQYLQRGLNNTQYQYQFYDESLTIPNTNSNIHEQS